MEYDRGERSRHGVAEGRIWSSNDLYAPPPYGWEQSKEVARLTIECLEAAVKAAEDTAELYERDHDLETIRTMQGVGIVLNSLLFQFKTNKYGQDDLEAAASKAFYFLEDF